MVDASTRALWIKTTKNLSHHELSTAAKTVGIYDETDEQETRDSLVKQYLRFMSVHPKYQGKLFQAVEQFKHNRK